MNVTDWLEEIKDAKKREDDFLKDGEMIMDLYEGEKDSPFNILYSNTETLLPAMFSNIPRPVVQRRFKDEDPLGKHAADASQRMLEYLIDRDVDDYDKFEDAMIDATLDGLLPGRGVTCIKYEADIDEYEDTEDEDGETIVTPPSVNNEVVCPDVKVWNRVYFGYAKKWSKVPWVAYEDYIDEKEAKERYESIEGLTFTSGEEEDEKDEHLGKRKTILIYQIWDKSSKKVIEICPQMKDRPLREDDDPLELTGFFNCPKPIQFVRKTGNTTPTALYSLYENQAEELNDIQRRLNKVIRALKVRGAYNGALGSVLENILDEDDNGLVPTDEATILADGGFDKNIWLLPIGELAGVAQQLYQARESCKRVIYEITGISDIVRGQSMASETLGAQKIKETWGTMRLKRMQKEAQRYALDMMRLMLEVAINKFSEDTWKKMTGLPFPTGEEKAQAQQIIQVAQQQMPPQMGQPPQLPPQVQQAQEISKLPSWEELLNVLRDDYWRSYRLDIETNSTLDVEATEDKQLVGEFMNAFAQFVNGISPMIADGTMPFEAGKSMMLAVVKRFRFGREVEEELKAMIPPKPPSNPEMEQAAKKLQQDTETFEKERKRAGEELDKRYMDLEKQEIEFKHQQDMAALKQKHMEEISAMKLENEQDAFIQEIDAQFEKQKRDMQSIMDKKIAEMEKKNANI